MAFICKESYQLLPSGAHIGDYVRIGTGAKILGPVKIGDFAVIGANAVVTRDVPAGTIVAGVPAKEIRRMEAQANGAGNGRRGFGVCCAIPRIGTAFMAKSSGPPEKAPGYAPLPEGHGHSGPSASLWISAHSRDAATGRLAGE